MGILDKLLGRGRSATKAGLEADVALEQAECPHVALVPKWDSAADIGIEAKASHYDCGVCGGSFTPTEAAELRATEAERIRHE